MLCDIWIFQTRPRNYNIGPDEDKPRTPARGRGKTEHYHNNKSISRSSHFICFVGMCHTVAWGGSVRVVGGLQLTKSSASYLCQTLLQFSSMAQLTWVFRWRAEFFFRLCLNYLTASLPQSPDTILTWLSSTQVFIDKHGCSSVLVLGPTVWNSHSSFIRTHCWQFR